MATVAEDVVTKETKESAELTMSDYLSVIDEREQEEQKAKQMQLEDSVTELKQISESQRLELKRTEEELTQARVQAQTLSADLIELNAVHEEELEEVKDRAEREAKVRADLEVESIIIKSAEEQSRIRREEQEKAQALIAAEQEKIKQIKPLPPATKIVTVTKTVTQLVPVTEVVTEKVIEKVYVETVKHDSFLGGTPMLTAFDDKNSVTKKDSVLDKVQRKLSFGKGIDKQ